MLASTQDNLKDEIKKHFKDEEVGKMYCLGRCHENHAFHYQGANYSGSSIDYSKVFKEGGVDGLDNYNVKSYGETILTVEFLGVDQYYELLKSILHEDKDSLLEEIKKSKVNGRGGAGFSLGMKLDACKQVPGEVKFIVCNADEGERRVQRVNAVIDPIEGTKVDGQIIVDMMNRMGYEQPEYHPATMLEEISQIVPFFKGAKWEELGINGKQWPIKEDGTDTQILHTKEFKIGKGRFNFKPFVETQEITAHQKDYPYIITTNRNLEHYNCGAMTRRTGNVEISTEDLLLINPKDVEEKFIKEGDLVCVESPRGKVDIKARITDEVKPGILSSTFHFPDIMLNNITSDIACSEALCPEYKVVSVNIRKSKGARKIVS